MTGTDCMDQIIAHAAEPLLSRAEERVLFPLAQAGDAAARERCLICDVALNPPPLPPRLERQRARRRVYEAMTRRARGARQISRGRPGGDNAG